METEGVEGGRQWEKGEEEERERAEVKDVRER